MKKTLPVIALSFSALLLISACGGNDEETLSESAADTMQDAGDSMSSAADDAMDKAGQATDNMAEAGQDMMEKAQDMTADTAISSEIKAKYIAETDLAAFEIEVGTQDGTVTLDGTVTSEPAKTRAEEIAAEVEGVMSVENNLNVEAAQ
ncbi:BON domain-containing protein [Granulosicoccaceae sp. 1_MG-2023]|nr:BON domain-containing protein [Granulosicoccaceae sp. 1_MG-2023]